MSLLHLAVILFMPGVLCYLLIIRMKFLVRLVGPTVETLEDDFVVLIPVVGHVLIAVGFGVWVFCPDEPFCFTDSDHEKKYVKLVRKDQAQLLLVLMVAAIQVALFLSF